MHVCLKRSCGAGLRGVAGGIMRYAIIGLWMDGWMDGGGVHIGDEGLGL